MWKEIAIHSLYFNAFLELCLLNYLWKMRGYPHFSFWIPITLGKIYLFPIVITFAKIHLQCILEGTVLNCRVQFQNFLFFESFQWHQSHEKHTWGALLLYVTQNSKILNEVYIGLSCRVNCFKKNWFKSFLFPQNDNSSRNRTPFLKTQIFHNIFLEISLPYQWLPELW